MALVQNPFKQPFYGTLPSQGGVDDEDDDTMEGMELAPSETSSQHNAHNLEDSDLKVRTNPPTPQILLSAG
jgi:hypothetical protein